VLPPMGRESVGRESVGRESEEKANKKPLVRRHEGLARRGVDAG
jgi:hypothetical protein